MNPQCILYADNSTVPVNWSSTAELEARMFGVQLNAEHWGSSNKLVLNRTKTEKIVFTRKRTETILSTCPNVKFLGVILDAGLTWSEHCDHLCNRLAIQVYLLRKLKPLVHGRLLMSAYHTLVPSLSCWYISLGHASTA